MSERTYEYDEFGMFSENAAEAGLDWSGPPTVVRRSLEVEPGRQVSALVWGEAPADLVLVHGGGQNAHTWDTVALAMQRPLVAIDLPGHGHSDWPGDNRALDPAAMADDIATVIAALAPESRLLVGMSLGGITALAAAARHPALVPRLVLVDVTPGVNEKKGSDIAAFLAGPESFATFDEILERTIAFNPTRSESSLRRGVLHNAVQREDGSWTWRHQLGRPSGSGGLHTDTGLDFGALWDVVTASTMPLLLVRGGLSPVVDDDDVSELLRRRPDAEVIVVDNAGHSIQGDRPVELARILTEFLASP